jgi:hypothetical protein
MDLQEILTEVGEEKAAVIQAAITAEKKLGIATSSKKGAENTKLIAEIAKYKDALREAAGIEDFGDDPVTKIKESIAALRAVKPNNATEGDALKALEQKLLKQQKESEARFQAIIAEKDKATEQAQTKFKNAKITSQLSDAMSGKIRGHDYVIKDLIREGKVRLDENEQAVFVGQDETETIDSKKWLESFTKERSDLVISQQIPGGGSAGNRVDASKMKQMSLADFNSLEAVDKAKFMGGGGKVI